MSVCYLKIQNPSSLQKITQIDEKLNVFFIGIRFIVCLDNLQANIIETAGMCFKIGLTISFTTLDVQTIFTSAILFISFLFYGDLNSLSHQLFQRL